LWQNNQTEQSAKVLTLTFEVRRQIRLQRNVRKAMKLKKSSQYTTTKTAHFPSSLNNKITTKTNK